MGELRGGLPLTQVRDMTVQKRENDLVLATFGRGFYVLDDYSALREVNPEALERGGSAVPAARRGLYNRVGPVAGRVRGHRPLSGLWTRGESAIRRSVHVSREAGAPADQKLVLTITDDAEAGAPARSRGTAPDCGARRGTCARSTGASGRTRVRVRRPRQQGGGQQPAADAAAAAAPSWPAREPGRYRATLGRMSGDIVTPIGQPQAFGVVLPQ